MCNPHQVTKDFESALCAYTGAPYAVAVNSCTMALFLSIKLHVDAEDQMEKFMRIANVPHDGCMPIEIPKRTYVSVPQAIIHAGGRPIFKSQRWRGAYQLKPLPVWDSARRFTSGMYIPGQFQCVSFHASKILGDTQGGAILHDSPEADAWFRKARFDGRTEGVRPKDDDFDMIGWHCYMSSDVAARLLLKLYSLPKHNADLLNDDYPDLSELEIFR